MTAGPTMKPRLRASLAAAVLAAVLPTALLVAPAAAADASPRVVNGREPLPEEVSGLVYVRAGSSLCSGTLVDATHVITAAHCVTNADASPLSPASIRVGWSETVAIPPAVYSVSSVHTFEYSGEPNFTNDIALLKLTLPIPAATPMPLTSPEGSRRLLAADRPLRSAGYGATTPTGRPSGRSYVGDLRVLPDSACIRGPGTHTVEGITFHSPWIYEVDVDVRTAVCAIGVVPGTDRIIDTCQGDSGGPLMGGTGLRQRLVGVVSAGVGCAGYDRSGELEFKVPGIYTRIAPYLDWLMSLGVDTIPEAPVITAAPSGVDGITISFTSSTDGAHRQYRAFATDGVSTVECASSRERGECVISGLTPGRTYSVIGYVFGTTYVSSASDSVTSVAGIPSVRPSKPRIDGAKTTPSRRLAVTVSRIDPAGWTSTFVVCNSGERTYRADVVEGKAVLALPSGATYRCYAKSTNDAGGTRSRPILVEL